MCLKLRELSVEAAVAHMQLLGLVRVILAACQCAREELGGTSLPALLPTASPSRMVLLPNCNGSRQGRQELEADEM